MSEEQILSLTTHHERTESMMFGKRLADMTRGELASCLVWQAKDLELQRSGWRLSRDLLSKWRAA